MELKNTSTQDLLKVAIANAIRGLELAYPLFKPPTEMIQFWSSSLMKTDFTPEDVIGGAEKVIFSGIEAFKIDLGRLTRACKDARSERIKKEDKALKQLENQPSKMLDIQGKSAYGQEMIKLMQEAGKYQKEGNMDEFKKKQKDIMKRHGQLE